MTNELKQMPGRRKLTDEQLAEHQAAFDRDVASGCEEDRAAADAPPPALRTDGPTLEEFVASGYKAENYPPQGYAKKASKDTSGT